MRGWRVAGHGGGRGRCVRGRERGRGQRREQLLARGAPAHGRGWYLSLRPRELGVTIVEPVN